MRAPILVLLVGCGSRPAVEKPEPLTADVVLHARHLIDVQTGTDVGERMIAIRGGEITEVAAWDAKRIAATRVIDLGDAHVLPGLIDAHVHLAWAAAAAGDKLPGTDEALATLRAGFTTVRNLGSTGGADIALERAISSGKLPGPRMLSAGTGLGAPGGICDQVFGEAKVTTAADAEREVDRLAAAGADVIKVCAGGGVVPSPRDASAVELGEDVLKTIVAAARKHDLRVAVHAQGSEAIVAAARAGVASVEHGSLIDERAIAALREHDVVLVPTLARLDFIVEQATSSGAPAQRIAALTAIRDDAKKRVREAVKAGVSIALGTDATVLPHGQNARELQALVDVGLSPRDALRAATVSAAALLGPRAGKIGVIANGYAADVIAVEGDPLADAGAVTKVVFVMKAGVVVRDDTAAPK